MEVREMQKAALANAIAKGFADPAPSFAEHMALVHSELSEALEDFRDGKHPSAVYFDPETGKPTGIPIELADAVIRIGNVAGQFGIDLQTAVEIKMRWNEGRRHKHGGKLL